MKDIFNSISMYSWKKISSLANIRNKLCYKKVRPQRSAIRYVRKNVLNLDGKDSIRFGIFQIAKKWSIV